MQKITPESLIPLDIFVSDFPVVPDLVYARAGGFNIFGKIYDESARLWVHEDIAAIALLAAYRAGQDGYTLVIYDGLRPVEAQVKMSESAVVQKNPHWLNGPDRLLSPPGGGGHPRGMAIDVSLQDRDGTLHDMGTDFDFLPEKTDAQNNPAHREHPHITEAVRENRARLDGYMMDAAAILSLPLSPYHAEWWDFRFPREYYEEFAPLSESDLPPEMYMVAAPSKADIADDLDKRDRILERLKPHIMD